MGDQLIKGTAKGAPLLVVGVSCTAAVAEAARIHDCHPTAAVALGRALGGALLFSAMLKEGQRVILQVAGDGPLGGIVAEGDAAGRTRGYVKQPHADLYLPDGRIDVGGAVGKGILSVVRDLGVRQNYRGSVPMQTGELAEDLAHYLHVSEQIPSAVALGVFIDPDGSVGAAGGYMLQALPGADDLMLEFLEHRITETKPVTAMLRDGMTPEEMLKEAIGIPFDILERKEPRYFCPCSRERVLNALAALPMADREELSEKGEPVVVTCEFCRTVYEITPEAIRDLASSGTEVEPG
ncbi:MAG TPA: Hsp33 family molecular chaperone HslO [Candidatus Deferrimicrobiaceae bacterium]